MTAFAKNLVCIPLLIALISCHSKQDSTEPVFFQHAAVVSAYPDASKVGAAILKQGGNAVDAAVAVSFALAVVYPEAGNIGGGGFMLIGFSGKEADALDFREKAPAAASRDMYLDSNGTVIPGASMDGQRSCGIPGSVDGLFQSHLKYGKLPWKELVQPAIDLAYKGFCISQQTADQLNKRQKDFMFYNPGGTCFIHKEGWKKGDRIQQEDLGKTLELIRDNGRDGFYTGLTAHHIVKEMQEGKGLITYDDLKNYTSVWRKPLTGFYKGYTITTMPPPSSGGIALLQLLKMTETFPIEKWGFHSTKAVHLATEAENRVYADRATWLGDPDFFQVPVKELLDSNYLLQRINNFDSLHSTPGDRIKAGTFGNHESEQTTHFSIVDQWGNAVSMTTTLNNAYGSKVFVKDAGFLLNDEMDDFSSKPGTANSFGLVGGKANAIEPGKRMLSSMTPTIITKDGKLFMVVGSPGGSTIITTVFQTIINVIDFQMTMNQAVNTGRFHSQWQPDELQMEKDALNKGTVEELQKMGHKVTERSPIGRCDAILLLPDNRMEAAADKRGDDCADGW